MRSVVLRIFRRPQPTSAPAAWQTNLKNLLAKASRGDQAAINEIRRIRQSHSRDITRDLEVQMLEALDAGEGELRHQERLAHIRLWAGRADAASTPDEAVAAITECLDAMAAGGTFEQFRARLERELGFTLETVIGRYDQIVSSRYQSLLDKAPANLDALKALHDLIRQNMTARRNAPGAVALSYPAEWNTWVATQHPSPPYELFDYSALGGLDSQNVLLFVARTIQDKDPVAAMIWLHYIQGNARRSEAMRGLTDQLALLAAKAYRGDTNRRGI